MGLREHASELLQQILNDEDCAMGWPIVLIDPAGFQSVAPLIGRTQDIAQVIDPDTGVLVSGRLVTVAIYMQDIIDAGYPSLPRAIADTSQKPWVVRFDDQAGASYQFKVVESNPDRTLGDIVLHLEVYE